MNMQDRMKRTPVTEQAPEVRAKNFKEVCLGYTEEQAIKEANRCLGCKNPKCVEGCPVSVNIPSNRLSAVRLLNLILSRNTQNKSSVFDAIFEFTIFIRA